MSRIHKRFQWTAGLGGPLAAVSAQGLLQQPLAFALAWGMWTVVPLGLSRVQSPGGRTRRALPPLSWMILPCATGAAIAHAFDAGALAGALTTGWLAVTLGVGWWGRSLLGHAGWRRPWRLCQGVAMLSLPVGALFMAAERFGGSLVGLPPPLQRLTAVHLHFATFVPLMLAAELGRWMGDWDTKLRIWVTALMLGPLSVALGYTVDRPLAVPGTLLLTLGLFGLCGQTASRVMRPPTSRAARAMLATACGAVLVSMPLACLSTWQTVGGPIQVDGPWMLLAHGLPNGLGLGLFGLLGWSRLAPMD